MSTPKPRRSTPVRGKRLDAILEYLKLHPNSTKREMAAVLNKSPENIGEGLRRLRDSKRVDKKRDGRTFRWFRTDLERAPAPDPPKPDPEPDPEPAPKPDPSPDPPEPDPPESADEPTIKSSPLDSRLPPPCPVTNETNPTTAAGLHRWLDWLGAPRKLGEGAPELTHESRLAWLAGRFVERVA